MKTLKDLAERLIEKNPSLVRDMTEAYYISFKKLIIKDGKVQECEIEKKQYKEEK